MNSKIHDECETLVHELARLTALGNPWIDPESEERLPRVIGAGANRSLSINRKMDRSIATIARLTRACEPVIKHSLSLKDWSAILRRSIGTPLAELNLDDDLGQNSRLLSNGVGTIVANQSAQRLSSFTHIFGTTWIETDFEPIRLGAATVETRKSWLKRQHASGAISTTTFRRLTNAFSGNKQRQRKLTQDRIDEDDILDVLGNSRCVISVKIEGVAGELAELRAARIARLVLMATALCWESPTRALQGLNLAYDDAPTGRTHLIWLEAGGFACSRSRLSLPTGPRLNPQAWRGVIERLNPVFSQAAAISESIAMNQPDCSRTKVLRKLELALRWFYEGCRSEDNLMSVTHFAAALDTLAGGDKMRGILKLLENQLDWPPTATIHVDGPTVGTVVKQIYSDARSRFLHGSTTANFEDWASLRGLAEFITRTALVECIFAADADPELADFHR